MNLTRNGSPPQGAGAHAERIGRAGERRKAGANKPSERHEPGPAVATMLSMDDVARALNCPRRLVERERRAGRFPKPDSRPGEEPRWGREALVRWIADWGGL